MIELAGPLPPFIPELRAAIRTSKKTQTRRVVKENIPDGFTPVEYGDVMTGWGALFRDSSDKSRYLRVKCPYGKPGDIRYLREPLYKGENDRAWFKDDDKAVIVNGLHISWRWKVNTLSSLFMPQECAQTFVKIERIHIERVQDISEADAMAEGVYPASEGVREMRAYRNGFRAVWMRLNDHRGYTWGSNLWVWVIEFSKYSPS